MCCDSEKEGIQALHFGTLEKQTGGENFFVVYLFLSESDSTVY
jgi:hypothetical protein